MVIIEPIVTLSLEPLMVHASGSVRRLPAGLTAAAMIGVVLGCSEDVGPPCLEVGSDIECITVEFGAETQRFTTAPSAFVEIGQAEGEAPYLFSEIVYATRLSTGNLVIADRGSRELRLFGSGGEFLESVGGLGRGPGEFAELTRVGRLAGDTLYIFDEVTQRLTILGPDMSLTTQGTPVDPFRGTQGRHLRGVFFGGRYLLTEERLQGSIASLPLGDTVRVPAHVVMHTLGRAETDTLLTMVGAPKVVLSYGAESGMGGIRVLAPIPLISELHAVGTARHIVASIPSREHYFVFSSTGELLRVIRPVPQTLRWIDRDVVERYAEMFPADERIQGVRALLGSPLPTYGDPLLDESDNLWVPQLALPWDVGEWQRYIIVDITGEAVGVADVPANMVVHDIRESLVIGSFLDDHHVPRVVVHQLVSD